MTTVTIAGSRRGGHPRNSMSGQEYLVYVAPAPVLAWLKRLHDRVLRVVKVLGRMLIFRRVAAADMPADEALAKMDPSVADL
jgi:hypothetical protein